MYALSLSRTSRRQYLHYMQGIISIWHEAIYLPTHSCVFQTKPCMVSSAHVWLTGFKEKRLTMNYRGWCRLSFTKPYIVPKPVPGWLCLYKLISYQAYVCGRAFLLNAQLHCAPQRSLGRNGGLTIPYKIQNPPWSAIVSILSIFHPGLEVGAYFTHTDGVSSIDVSTCENKLLNRGLCDC